MRQFRIRSHKPLYRGRYRLDEIVFDADRVTGRGQLTSVSREVFERGDSVAALIHDIERDVIVLTEQFRAATAEKGPGYIVEAMAGSLEEGEEPEACVRREALEETGYRLGEVTPVGRAYASPGSSSERLFLYYAPVSPKDLIDSAASGVDEHEDVLRIELLRTQFLKQLELGVFEDAKILMLGWWLRSRPRRGKPVRSS